MKKGFEVGTFYFCNQGNVYICKSSPSGDIFLMCEECFTDWPTPDDFLKMQSGIRKDLGQCEYLTKAEMQDHPWRPYVQNTADLED